MTRPMPPRQFLPPSTTACEGKRRHKDYDTAAEEIVRLYADPRYGKRDGPSLRAYECAYCGGWHIGHSKRGSKHHAR